MVHTVWFSAKPHRTIKTFTETVKVSQKPHRTSVQPFIQRYVLSLYLWFAGARRLSVEIAEMSDYLLAAYCCDVATIRVCLLVAPGGRIATPSASKDA